MGKLQEAPEFVRIYGSCYLTVLYHLIGILICRIRSGNSPRVCRIHNLGAPVTLGRFKRNFIGSVSVSVHIPIPERSEDIHKLLRCFGNFLSRLIEPLFIHEHDTHCIVFIAGLSAGHQGTDGAVRPGYQIKTAGYRFIIRINVRGVILQHIIRGQIRKGVHIVCYLALAYQSQKSIRQIRSEHNIYLVLRVRCRNRDPFNMYACGFLRQLIDFLIVKLFILGQRMEDHRNFKGSLLLLAARLCG